MPIAPHEGQELNYVMMGKKPLACIDRTKQPEMYDRAMRLKYVVSVKKQTEDMITVTDFRNSDLHTLFEILSSTRASVIVRTKKEKHRLLGRLFGYSEEDIEEFLAADMQCACGQCKWDDELHTPVEMPA